MNVVVDTSVWSLALRRNTPNDAIAIINILRDLITDGRVVLLGVIRQDSQRVIVGGAITFSFAGAIALFFESSDRYPYNHHAA